jgi:acetyltransferase-like isoleucine patch superfamily enzyme
MSLKTIIVKIKRRETPFYNRLYLFLKSAQAVDIPVIRPLHLFLLKERTVRHAVWHWLTQNLYYVPLFKSQCRSYGKNLLVLGGLPQIYGDLGIDIGDNCVLHGATTLVGAKVFDDPTLRIGNNTHLGYSLNITVGCDITIGSDVMIAGGVTIFSYDGHAANPMERHAIAPKETSKPVTIEDNVWVGMNCTIMKGVTIGRNSVIVPGSVVTQKIPPDSLVIGNPARVFPLIY